MASSTSFCMVMAFLPRNSLSKVTVSGISATDPGQHLASHLTHGQEVLSSKLCSSLPDGFSFHCPVNVLLVLLCPQRPVIVQGHPICLHLLMYLLLLVIHFESLPSPFLHVVTIKTAEEEACSCATIPLLIPETFYRVLQPTGLMYYRQRAICLCVHLRKSTWLILRR